jgi:hypothetical protein
MESRRKDYFSLLILEPASLRPKAQRRTRACAAGLNILYR